MEVIHRVEIAKPPGRVMRSSAFPLRTLAPLSRGLRRPRPYGRGGDPVNEIMNRAVNNVGDDLGMPRRVAVDDR